MASTPPDQKQQAVGGPQETMLPSGKSYTVEALRKAHSEVQLEGSLAQNLLMRWWEDAVAVHDDVPMQKVQTAIDKCFRIGEEFRKKLSLWEFEKRERYDKEERDRYKKDGKSLIIIPDAAQVMPHVPGGYIPGLDQ